VKQIKTFAPLRETQKPFAPLRLCVKHTNLCVFAPLRETNKNLCVFAPLRETKKTFAPLRLCVKQIKTFAPLH
jgi:hypothetical protein